MTRVECQYFPICSGCQFIGLEVSEQRTNKINDLQKFLSEFYRGPALEIGWYSGGEFGTRDRLDFVWEENRLGMYSLETKKIHDLPTCGQLSSDLAAWYQEFRRISWPLRKGSIRLRVGPQGSRGVWLDFANEDIKKLLEEKTILQGLLKKAVVEIGQKRKVLKEVNGVLKLKDPESHLWFESQFQGKTIPIYSYIGSFTQPSLKANQVLLSEIATWVEKSDLQKASEFGSGIGNLSFMLLGCVKTLDVYENDALSLESFKKTLSLYPQYFSSQEVNFHTGNYQKKQDLNFVEDEILLVNPPRSGLKDFLGSLEPRQKPQVLIYMSCAPDSWARDGHNLQKMGYQLKELKIVDQFPQTRHYEVLSFWTLN